MRFFLHWSCTAVCGILAFAIQQAYGWLAWALALFAGLYVMLAQWYEGRYCK